MFVEYCESTGLDRFLAVADAIEERFPVAVSGNDEAAVDPPRPGAFEVVFRGVTLFSKLEKQRMPEEEEILEGVHGILDGGGTTGAVHNAS